jgi:hypothetical protein
MNASWQVGWLRRWRKPALFGIVPHKEADMAEKNRFEIGKPERGFLRELRKQMLRILQLDVEDAGGTNELIQSLLERGAVDVALKQRIMVAHNAAITPMRLREERELKERRSLLDELGKVQAVDRAGVAG